MAENTIAAVRVLVVSREPGVLTPLRSIAKANAWQLETAGSGWEALEQVQSGNTPHLLLLDWPRGNTDNLHALRWLRRVRPDLPIILLSHADDAGEQVEAIRLGARDYLVRPLEQKELETVIKRHLNSQSEDLAVEVASDDIEQISDDLFFVAASPIMRKLRAQIELLAQVNVPVLIVGENGSGKEVVARLIHKLSVRSGSKFLKMNCAALPGDLLESELFGYERDPVTGATRTKVGKFELCEKGTILLDDVNEMPLDLQARLLNVMKERQFSRRGSETAIEVDIRILAATNVNIEQALAQKSLREDLYYRLSAFTVQVPPLRQRRDEIQLLLRHFMHHLARHYSLPPRTFSASMLHACQRYSWPGNLRELENFVKRYLVMGDEQAASGELEGDARMTALARNSSAAASIHDGSKNGDSSLRALVQNAKGETERSVISSALEKTGWNRKAAARLLKVSYRTLLYKIEQYHMTPSQGPLAPLVGQGLKNNGSGFNGNGR